MNHKSMAKVTIIIGYDTQNYTFIQYQQRIENIPPIQNRHLTPINCSSSRKQVLSNIVNSTYCKRMPIEKPEIDFCNKTHSLLHREIRINCHSYMVMLTLQVSSQSIASVIAKHCKCHRKALQVPSQSFASAIEKLCKCHRKALQEGQQSFA